MRKTSFGLGLAGAILAFLLGIILLLVGVFFSAVRHTDWDIVTEGFDDVEVTIDDEYFSIDLDEGFDFNPAPRNVFGFASGILIFIACLNLIAGVLGIIGTCITRKRRSVGAGVMLIIAGVLSLPWGFIAFGLLIAAGILAFINEKNNVQQIPAHSQTTEEDII